MHIGQRIQQKMTEQHISQNKLAKAAQISQSGLSSIISGASSPKESTVQAIAKALSCSASELMGEVAPGFIPILRNAIPVIGSIACGTPTEAIQTAEGYLDIPESIHADFALRCKGDSMEPTFRDGDLVLIRIQPDVENGQIAAVNIGGETTLKHVYHQPEGLLLVADNPAYSPIYARADSEKEIVIHGLAVGYTRIF